MSRPTKLTAEVQTRICNAIKAGNYYEAAAVYGGVDYQTFRNWMKRGKVSKRGIYFEFFEAVTKANADAEVRIVAQWVEQIPMNWAAARDFLQRRYPKRWAPKEKLELSGNQDKPITVQAFDYGAAIAPIAGKAGAKTED